MHKGLLELGKVSVSAHYSGACCPYCGWWGKKKRGRKLAKNLRKVSGKDYLPQNMSMAEFLSRIKG